MSTLQAEKAWSQSTLFSNADLRQAQIWNNQFPIRQRKIYASKKKYMFTNLRQCTVDVAFRYLDHFSDSDNVALLLHCWLPYLEVVDSVSELSDDTKNMLFDKASQKILLLRWCMSRRRFAGNISS